VRAAQAGAAKRAVMVARADVDRAEAAAGTQLPPGEWDVKAVVEVGGFRAAAQSVKPPREGLLGLRRGTMVTLIAPRKHGLLPRPRLRRRVARRFPRVARALGRRKSRKTRQRQ
jgi:hypothetical protein